MFISKKTHDREIQLLQEQVELLKESYEARIRELIRHMEDLKRLVFSPASASEIPREAREADAVISVSEKPIDQSDAEHFNEDELLELDRIVSGEHERMPE